MKRLIIIAHNLRSAHNVGSLLRTADGLGVDEVIFSGYTPYPPVEDDSRLPHEQRRIEKQIDKTALGAVQSQAWRHRHDVDAVFQELRAAGFVIAALEQASGSVNLPDYRMPEKLALVLGREAEGLEPDILAACDLAIEIPMYGQKESFNVVQAAAMAMYQWRCLPG